MNVNPMEEQVGRIIGNLLAAGGTVLLPGVGSLRPERRAARRVARRMVEPPCRTVVFSSQEQGTSLVAEIARILCADGTPAGEADAAARTVYARWTERARRGDALVVEGVGVLKYKHFSLDEAFDLRLNPQGHAPMKIRSGRPDWVIWVGAAAVVAAVGIGVSSFLLNDTERPQPLAGTAVPGLATAESPVSPGVPADSLSAEHAAAGSAAPVPEEGGKAVAGSIAAGGTPEQGAAAVQSPDEVQRPAGYEPAAMTSKRNYVVLGVFSSQENAVRAAKKAASDSEEAALTCGVYRFGAKFLVSPFESDDPEACRLFIRAHADRFPGMWTYTAR